MLKRLLISIGITTILSFSLFTVKASATDYSYLFTTPTDCNVWKGTDESRFNAIYRFPVHLYNWLTATSDDEICQVVSKNPNSIRSGESTTNGMHKVEGTLEQKRIKVQAIIITIFLVIGGLFALSL